MRLCGSGCFKSLIQKLLLISFLFFALSSDAYSQEFLKTISENNKKNYREELIIQTDRDLYIIGELVLLKVFKLNGYNKKPDNISKVVYIELVNSSGFPVEQIKINVKEKSGAGSFYLSDTLSSGNYFIRAYTNWMRNFDEEYFAYRNISIINPFHNPGKTNILPEESLVDTILFFPEGGTLITGIKSKVGFYAIDKQRNLQEIEGAIINERNDTIEMVRSEKSGYGTFYINPGQNRNYRLLYTPKTGETRVFPIAKVLNSGIHLSVDFSGQNRFFKVNIENTPDFDVNQNKYFVLVLSNGFLKYAKAVDQIINHSLNLETSKLSPGLAQIILTNEKGKQLSNRWIYNPVDKKINFHIKTDKEKYSTREKVRVEVFATDNEGNPLEADLSVSVIKSFLVNSKGEDMNIGYNLLSGSDTEILSNELLDINDKLLFYTRGNSDFAGEGSFSGTNLRYLPEPEGKIICGTIINSITEGPVKNVDMAFSLVGKIAKCQFYNTNDRGEFYFVMNETGLQEIVIQPLETGFSNYYIELKPDFITTSGHFQPRSFYLDTSLLEKLNNSIISMQVQKIYKPYLNNDQTVVENMDSINFFGDAIRSVQISEFIQLTTVREVIKELVPNVWIRKKNDKLFLRFSSDINGQIFNNDPLVIIDGTPFNDVDQILKMNSSVMERIDVLNLKYFIDGQAFDGIINFVTKKGNLDALEFNHSVFRQAYSGYNRSSGFYSPDYRNDSLRSSRIPDFRNTLYWNSDLRCKTNDTLTFEFYTSDEPGNYTIKIEGISQEGYSGKVRKEISVD